MRAHALLSASGSSRWMACTPSPRLEEEREEQTSIYAEEGTFMHELSELHLNLYLGHIGKVAFNKQLKQMKKNEFYTAEIESAVQVYVDLVIERTNDARAQCKDALILIEQRLDYSPWAAEGFGTGDVLIISDQAIEVIDLKGGKGIKVDSEDNSQMRLYALGALNGFGFLYEAQTVLMTIIQPRLDHISTAEISKEDLLKWGEEEVKPKAALAFAGEGDFAAGEHCRFCKVKASCRARAKENMALTRLDFKAGPLLTDDEIVEVLLTVKELQKWAKDVETYAFTKAVKENKEWPGMKLVEGRSSRKYSSETEVAQLLIKTGYPEETIYSKSLLSLTALEKQLGKKKFEETVGHLIIKPPGNMQLVAESDKRQAVKNSAQIDFKTKGE